VHPAILPDASGKADRDLLTAVLESAEHFVHLVFQAHTMFLHVFDSEIVNRQVFFFKALDFFSQVLIFFVQIAKQFVGGFQRLNRLQILGKFMVKVVVFNLHDHRLSLIPIRPMRDRCTRL
jgi:hypothetical protein